MARRLFRSRSATVAPTPAACRHRHAASGPRRPRWSPAAAPRRFPPAQAALDQRLPSGLDSPRNDDALKCDATARPVWNDRSARDRGRSLRASRSSGRPSRDAAANLTTATGRTRASNSSDRDRARSGRALSQKAITGYAERLSRSAFGTDTDACLPLKACVELRASEHEEASGADCARLLPSVERDVARTRSRASLPTRPVRPRRYRRIHRVRYGAELPGGAGVRPRRPRADRQRVCELDHDLPHVSER